MSDADVILAGIGLANGLIALRLAEARPGTRILMLDAEAGPTDRHTWSFHDPDLAPDWHRRLSPGLRARWSGQEVRFPDHARTLRAGYASMDDAGLLGLLTGAPGVTLGWGADVATLDPDGVSLTSGGRLAAPCIIDGRGAAPSPHLVTGWQKFLGLEIETPAPHGVARPIIMDATVPQQDGYRFVYTLPLSPTRLLIEDTRYSDGPDLDHAALTTAIHAYAAAHGQDGVEVRREAGVLPIALAHDAEAFWAEQTGAVPVGLRAGLFHPVTGYSLPVAARIADVIAAAPALTTAAVREAVRAFALAKSRDDRFLRLLNRMLFRGCRPERRHRVLSRFYRLPEPLIERFYAGRLTRLDRLRIVAGKPPIPIRNAILCLPEAPLLPPKPRPPRGRWSAGLGVDGDSGGDGGGDGGGGD